MKPETMERCVEYARDLYAGDSPTQRWILREVERRGFPRIEVSPVEGRILAVLVALSGARRLLELGTLGGYSALWLLTAAPEDARLVTVERDPDRGQLAREAFRRAGVQERVDLRIGEAGEILRELSRAPSGTGPPFDFAFLDADKENYPRYLEQLSGLLAQGGVLAADNVFWDGRVLDPPEEDDPATRGIREFNRELASSAEFVPAVIPVRDGLTVASFRG